MRWHYSEEGDTEEELTKIIFMLDNNNSTDNNNNKSGDDQVDGHEEGNVTEDSYIGKSFDAS